MRASAPRREPCSRRSVPLTTRPGSRKNSILVHVRVHAYCVQALGVGVCIGLMTWHTTTTFFSLMMMDRWIFVCWDFSFLKTRNQCRWYSGRRHWSVLNETHRIVGLAARHAGSISCLGPLDGLQTDILPEPHLYLAAFPLCIRQWLLQKFGRLPWWDSELSVWNERIFFRQ